MSFIVSLAETRQCVRSSMTADQLEQRINELADEIETAQENGAHGYAEELYAECERLQEQLDKL